MADEHATSAARAFDRLLDLERDCLLKGDLAGVGDLIPRKQHLATQLGTSTSSTELQTIGTKALRNQRLLDAALEGINSAAARVRELGALRAGLDVYDRSGGRRRHTVSASGSQIRRA